MTLTDCSTFDLQNLTRSSVGAGEYSKSVLSKSFKPLMRYRGNNTMTKQQLTKATMRAASLYPRPVTRTKRYTSFINYSLLHCQ